MFRSKKFNNDKMLIFFILYFLQQAQKAHEQAYLKAKRHSKLSQWCLTESHQWRFCQKTSIYVYMCVCVCVCVCARVSVSVDVCGMI